MDCDTSLNWWKGAAKSVMQWLSGQNEDGQNRLSESRWREGPRV